MTIDMDKVDAIVRAHIEGQEAGEARVLARIQSDKMDTRTAVATQLCAAIINGAGVNAGRTTSREDCIAIAVTMADQLLRALDWQGDMVEAMEKQARRAW